MRAFACAFPLGKAVLRLSFCYNITTLLAERLGSTVTVFNRCMRRYLIRNCTIFIQADMPVPVSITLPSAAEIVRLISLQTVQ